MDSIYCHYHFPFWDDDDDDNSPPKPPDLTAFHPIREQVRADFRAELRTRPEGQPPTLMYNIDGLGEVVIQLFPIHHTAAVIEIARYAEPPAICIRLTTAVLFSGLADADAAALDIAASLTLFKDFPHLLHRVRAAPRPLLLQTFPDRAAFNDPLRHAIGLAAATAFFEQFGDSLPTTP